ncbi:hypothetical protein HIM_08086 [Hirsutella minnesotensis 3608]|uniref:RRM domain-containing protein n=1 Tax=Hirsutella minnesotensis 3608 TaxID=1043627 RepID=A0A0F7ZYJ1_9HYPO|nr:hypothetical protein HIM_08086 [Hirsutella minnesotensis 3608]
MPQMTQKGANKRSRAGHLAPAASPQLNPMPVGPRRSNSDFQCTLGSSPPALAPRASTHRVSLAVFSRPPRPSRFPSPRRTHHDAALSPREQRSKAKKTWRRARRTKIVVERLSKNVREAHLREIFGFYGPIQDLDLPINRTFGTNRGTAYILYEHREDAEDAIANMHEGQIEGAIINVSIVLPRRMFSPEPPLARRGANIDPRNQIGGPSRGGRGGRGFSGGHGFHGEGRGGRRRPPSPGRFGARQTGYPPSERSRSRSPVRSPPRGPRGRGSDHKPRSFSRDSRSLSRSRSPPPRRGGGSRYDDGPRRRSRSRSYDSYAARNRSISPRRDYR